MNTLQFPYPLDTPAMTALRAEVREFISQEQNDNATHAYLGGADAEFSRKMGRKGWIGMCWPRQYGGSERSVLERYVVAEELLVARVPLGFHWIADRQAGPLLLKYGTEQQRQTILPQIAAGTLRFCIGMSEADSGSDLASVRMRAQRVDGGFIVSGAKLWTSSAHESDFMITLCRTSTRTEARHEGLSQLLVDLRLPGIECRQIPNIAGESDFNEVVFHDVFVAQDMLVGREGQGWDQVTAELAHERAGPERFLSSFGVLVELIDLIGAQPSEHCAIAVGRLVAQLATVRWLSRSVATMLHVGELPTVQAAMVKDLGTNLEQEICEVVRSLAGAEASLASLGFTHSLAEVMLRAPSFTLRGGAREVLRGIIARGIGLR